jgi:hypothetical protein
LAFCKHQGLTVVGELARHKSAPAKRRLEPVGIADNVGCIDGVVRQREQREELRKCLLRCRQDCGVADGVTLGVSRRRAGETGENCAAERCDNTARECHAKALEPAEAEASRKVAGRRPATVDHIVRQSCRRHKGGQLRPGPARTPPLGPTAGGSAIDSLVLWKMTRYSASPLPPAARDRPRRH